MKLSTRLAAPLLILAFSGCAGIDYAKTNYGGYPQQQFKAANGQTFEIIDNPSRGRLMIGPGAAVATEGFVKNWEWAWPTASWQRLRSCTGMPPNSFCAVRDAIAPLRT